MSTTVIISPQANCLDNLVLYEPCDVEILDKLINSTLLLKTFRNKTSTFFYENEKAQLEMYLDLFQDGRAKIHYTRPEGMPYGRSNPVRALGLFPIRRQIRHTLAAGRFIDFDIENCHPMIKLQILQKNNLPHTELLKYCTNRDVFFKDIMEAYNCTRDQAKTLMIAYLNGGTMQGWLEDGIDKSKINKAFIKVVNGQVMVMETADNQRFRKEQSEINKHIVTANPNMVSYIIERKKAQGKPTDDNSIARSAGAIYLQEFEIRVLDLLQGKRLY
jgi:hypothetical protein